MKSKKRLDEVSAWGVMGCPGAGAGAAQQGAWRRRRGVARWGVGHLPRVVAADRRRRGAAVSRGGRGGHGVAGGSVVRRAPRAPALPQWQGGAGSGQMVGALRPVTLGFGVAPPSWAGGVPRGRRSARPHPGGRAAG